MRKTLLTLLISVCALADEPRPTFPDDYTPSPCAQSEGLCVTFKPSELLHFGARALASYVDGAWLKKHWDELTPKYAPYCAKLATCYAQAPNDFLFCDDVVLTSTRSICAHFPEGSDDRQQCLFFLKSYNTGIQLNSIATWRAAQACAAKLPPSATLRKLDWWMVPAQLPAGFNGKFTIYTTDAETHVPIQANIKIGDEIIYAKRAPSGLPMTFFEVDWKTKLVRADRVVVPPTIKVETAGYEAITFPLPLEIPKILVDMTPSTLEAGKNEVTFFARDSATNKPVDARILFGETLIGHVDIRTGKLTATIDVQGSKRAEIRATSPFDAWSDVVIAPARK
jgi:hypothetical protein